MSILEKDCKTQKPQTRMFVVRHFILCISLLYSQNIPFTLDIVARIDLFYNVEFQKIRGAIDIDNITQPFCMHIFISFHVFSVTLIDFSCYK